MTKAKNTIDHRLRKNPRSAELWRQRKQEQNKEKRLERLLQKAAAVQ